MITKENVIQIFKILFEREPENEEVIVSHIERSKDLSHLMKIVRNSDEFKMKEKKTEELIKKNTTDTLLIFLHIPKTAGTLLREQWFFKNEKIIKSYFWIDLSILTEKEVYNKYSHYYNILPLRLMGGHWSLNKWLKLPILQNKLITGIIREPLIQVLSHYNYIQNIDKLHPINKLLKDKTLREVVEDKRFINNLVNLQLRYIFNKDNRLCCNDKIIIGKHEKLEFFIKSINKYSSIGEINLQKEKENTGGNYMDKLKKEKGFDEAIEILKNLLKKEYEFYNSFDSILEMDYKKYELLNKKFS